MKKFLGVFILIVFVMPISVVGQRGCCSHHGGVAGCGANGRQICNDGTYSPTCTCSPSVAPTPNYRYGCTDPNAYNYDSSANKDNGSCIAKVYGCIDKNSMNYNVSANIADGSCQYRKEIMREEDVSYSTKTVKGEKKAIKQKGVNGKKQIIEEQVVNEQGEIISSNIKEEKVIMEPVEEIVVEVPNTSTKEKQVTTSKKENQQKNNKTENKDEENSILATIFGIGLIGGIGYIIYRKKRN